MKNDEGVSFGSRKRSDRLLIGIFVTLMVVIVGLGIAVTLSFVLNGNSEDKESDLPENAVTQNDAFSVAFGINERYDNDPDYYYDEAVADYEQQMSQGDDWYKFSIACYYARFLRDQGNDLNAALDVMGRAGEYVKTDNANQMIDYYVVVRDLYKGVNDEMYDYYNGEIIKLSTVKEVNDAGLPVEE